MSWFCSCVSLKNYFIFPVSKLRKAQEPNHKSSLNIHTQPLFLMLASHICFLSVHRRTMQVSWRADSLAGTAALLGHCSCLTHSHTMNCVHAPTGCLRLRSLEVSQVLGLTHIYLGWLPSFIPLHVTYIEKTQSKK